MAISLTHFKRAQPLAGDSKAALAALQQRLTRLNIGQGAHAQRMIVLLEGAPGAGKKEVLRLLAGALDPCSTAVHCAESAEFGDDGRHWLAPYWERLPKAGRTALFYRGWHHRAVAERCGGSMRDKAWARIGDEINEFEAQQVDHGTLLVKLFLHASSDVQAKRLAERRRDPWLGTFESGTPAASSVAVWEGMLTQTDTRWAPWKIVDAESPVAAQVDSLSEVAEALQRAVPSELSETRSAIPFGREPAFG